MLLSLHSSRSIFRQPKYASIRVEEITHVSTTRFDSDPPNKPPGQRSRIGDVIHLFDSPELADKLKTYDEEFRFDVSPNFNVTIKGGTRGADAISGQNIFSNQITTAVINSANSAGYDPTKNQ